MGATRKRGPAYSSRRKHHHQPATSRRLRNGNTRTRKPARARPSAPPPVRAEPAGRDPAIVRQRTVIGFLVGILVGAAVLAAAWAMAGSPGGDTSLATAHDPGAGTRQVTPRTTAGPRAADTAATPTPLQSCRHADGEVRRALDAAGPAMSQWEVHVGAMNKLVAGAITLPQATAFWNNTRVAARQHLASFRRSERQATLDPATCRHPMAAMPGMGGSPRLKACVRRLAADRRVLAAADTAMTTWRRHVVDMEMLRAGSMSPTRATRMWLSSWQEGVRQIRAYHQAERAARASGVC